MTGGSVLWTRRRWCVVAVVVDVVVLVLLVVLVVLVVSGAVVNVLGGALALVVLVVLAELPHPAINPATSSATTDPPLQRPEITD